MFTFLYYGLDACPLNRDQAKSLEFAVNSCFRKIFCVRSQTVIEECKMLFNCPPVFETMTTKKYKFLHKYMYRDNELCKLFNDRAIADLSIRSCLAVLRYHYSVVKIS